MKIGGLAEKARCLAVTIHYYENMGLPPNDRRNAGNQRIYDDGTGMMSVDNEVFPVREGTCIKGRHAGCRGLENTGTGNLRYICIQAKENSLEQSLFEDGEICE